MSFSIRSLRKTALAKATLFLWLFGFMVGVAHACLGLPTGDAQAQASAMVVDATQATNDCDDTVVQQACIAARESEQGTLVNAKSQPGADSAPAPGVIAPWRELSAVAPARVWHVAAAPPPGPPVAILFLRLTI